MDLGALFRKLVLGDQSADVIKGVNVANAMKKPTIANDPVIQQAGNEMIAEGQAKIAARNAAGVDGSGVATTYAAPTAAQIKASQDAAKKSKLKSESMSSLDELMNAYELIKGLIKKTGADQTGRLNKEYDDKVNAQVEDMKTGMYETDASNAANNLGDSSFRSFDRSKVRKAADSNVTTLNSSRANDVAAVGRMVSEDTAKYDADQAGIARTRSMLNETDDLDELQATANNLDSTKRGVNAAKGKYGEQGEFAAKANSLGNYDTSALEQSLQSVVANAAADPSTKVGTINDLLDGVSALDDKKKDELRTKYTQQIG